MELDDHLKQLMKELGTAINESLSDSEPIAQAISNIKGAGYDVFLVLEATIGFNRRDEEESDEAEGEPEMQRFWTGKLELTNQDAKFLRSLRIRVDDDQTTRGS
jgi:hypothetical protein